jgi:hypothetical protein
VIMAFDGSERASSQVLFVIFSRSLRALPCEDQGFGSAAASC